jgi:hypothetical protein
VALVCLAGVGLVAMLRWRARRRIRITWR